MQAGIQQNSTHFTPNADANLSIAQALSLPRCIDDILKARRWK